MASSGVMMAQTFLYTIPRSSATAIALFRRATQSNSRLWKAPRARRPPTSRNQAEREAFSIFPAGRERALSAGFHFSVHSAPAPLFTHSPYNPRMDNKQIARILRETAQLLEIDG